MIQRAVAQVDAAPGGRGVGETAASGKGGSIFKNGGAPRDSGRLGADVSGRLDSHGAFVPLAGAT